MKFLFNVIAGIPITLYFWPGMHLHLLPPLPHHWLHGHPTQKQACLQHFHSKNANWGQGLLLRREFSLLWLDHFLPRVLYFLSPLAGPLPAWSSVLYLPYYTY